MTEIILDEAELVANIRDQFKKIEQLKYKRSLLEFANNDGSFLGDNVFETSFKMRQGLPPLIYEVSGPYDTISNEYATIGRIYERGKRIFEADIKQQIQQRTAAMVWMFFSALGHTPKKILMVGAGKLAIETVRYLKHFMPTLKTLDYHARNQRIESFEARCDQMGVSSHFQEKLEFEQFDTIIMVTNTNACLIDSSNIETIRPGAFIASLCTTSQTGEITGDIYGRDDVNTLFDYDLTRSFTSDMQAADNAGNLKRVTFLNEILNGKLPSGMSEKKNLLRITGTPMQNVAVLDMMSNL